MSKLTFTHDLSAALKSSEHLFLLAPTSRVADGLWGRVFKAAWAKDLARLAKDGGSKPSNGPGRLVTTWPSRAPVNKVTLGLLPESVSRHLPPSRSQAAADCATKAELWSSGSLAVVACVESVDQWVPLANAVARALPIYDRRASRKPNAKATFVAIGPDAQPIKADPAHVAVVESSRWAASLVDTPTAEMTTADFVSAARQALKGVRGVKVSVIEGDALLDKGLGGIHAVGRAAAVGPRMLVLQHGVGGAAKKGKKKSSSRGAGAGPHVALVGKGIVYDTGGLNIKVGAGMFGMKCDMGGGAAVAGAFRALVRGGWGGPLTCLVPLAENSVGPDSYRPDDILTMHSGKTVEINNTDAEGRLLLADGVSWAAREVGADVVIDAATLTGAQMVATGKNHAGVVSNREGIERAAIASGLRSGDAVHPLPFAPEVYQAEFKSDVADMMNSVADRLNAQASCAAQFVYSHVQDLDTPWLHVDLAGPVMPKRRATGFGVALLDDLVRTLGRDDLQS